ncbi:LLM class F420-dependent oxidoreductase [Streptomyces sp. NPDC006129]|uniref:LLM class F420-dependent oxidoreductase n=1 Tax=Streptomyces sp. NPDC006129 TaxID=3155348 RepID=UPI0033A6E3EF
MKFGYHAGYWSAKPPVGVEGLVAEAERLGFDSLWTAEAYGSDAVAPLAWWGARTTALRLGTGIMQTSARTPTATAMTALTLDHLTGGRFVLGLGASGPQVVEGWYGLPYPKPLARMREYIDVVRAVIAREQPVRYDGKHYQLPYPGGTGLGKPLKSTLHPLRREIPIHLAAEGPKNVALAAEIADGWLPFLFSPRSNAYYKERLEEGFARRLDARSPKEAFEVIVSAPIAIDDDLERAMDKVRPLIALYVGGMGAKNANFHADVVARMGYEGDVAKIQELYLSGHKREAIAAVPAALIQDLALVGSKAKIRDDLAAWDESLATTMLIRDEDPHVLRTMAELTS